MTRISKTEQEEYEKVLSEYQILKNEDQIRYQFDNYDELDRINQYLDQ